MLRIILVLFCGISQVFSGAWVQNKGQGLDIVTAQYYRSHQYWTPAGNLKESPLYMKDYGSNYFEYGLTEKFTLGLYFSGLESHTAAAGTHGGSNDNLLLGRYQLWKTDYSVISTQFYIDGLGRASRLNIPPQNSKLNTGEAILFGTSGAFGPKNDQYYWFCDASIGLVQRYGPGNQVQVILESGFKFNSEKFWIFVQGFNTISTRNTDYPEKVAYNLFTIAPSVMFWFSKQVGVQIGATQDFYGQNVGRGFGPYLSTWIRF